HPGAQGQSALDRRGYSPGGEHSNGRPGSEGRVEDDLENPAAVLDSDPGQAVHVNKLPARRFRRRLRDDAGDRHQVAVTGANAAPSLYKEGHLCALTITSADKFSP